MKVRFSIRLILLFTFNTFGIFAQTQISGIVYDVESNEPLTYATVAFSETRQVGCFTDLNGKYAVATDKPVKNLIVSFVGYKTQTIPIKQGEIQKIKWE